MSVTINAHQLLRLIDDTRSHMADEYTEPLHGIWLDRDQQHLHAVATDRYTLVASRYGLLHDDKGGEPWARTLPAVHVPALREWLDAMQGAEYIKVHPDDGQIIFKAPHSTFAITVGAGLMFPDWRGLFRGITEQTVDGEPFPALATRFLKRFGDRDRVLRVRTTADLKAVLFIGEDFIGVQMPGRVMGVGRSEDETFDYCRSLWEWTFAEGGDGVTMADLPAEDRPRYDTATDVGDTRSGLLQVVLDETAEMFGKSKEAPELFHAHVIGACHGWMAYRYLDALHNADPRLAAQVVADVAEQLDSGEIGEFAWDAAEAAGFDPKAWAAQREARIKKAAESAEAAVEA